MPERLEVVPARLLAPEMSVDRHVPRSARERLSLAVRDMYFRLGVTVVLCHAEVCAREERIAESVAGAGEKEMRRITDDVDGVGGLRTRYTDQEVVRLDVAVYERFLVYRLYPRYLETNNL